MDSKAAIQNFKNYLFSLNRSENTIHGYELDICQFFELMDVGELSEVNEQTAEDYSVILAGMGLSPASRCRKLSALGQFYDYMMKSGTAANNPFEGVMKPKIPQKEAKPIPDDDIRRIIQWADETGRYGKVNHRNRVIIRLLFATGIRRNELTNIKLQNIDMGNGSILIDGKGNKQRVVYFGEKMAKILNGYINHCRNEFQSAKGSEYLFVSEKSGKLSDEMVNSILNRAYNELGIKDKGYVVHSTRKSFATSVYANSKDIVAVQKLLGHSNPQTTMRYVGVDEESKKRAALTINININL